MAEIYSKSGEHVLILGVREAFVQPFEATDWLDLRVGFFISVTDDTGDDTITGLSEDIGATDATPLAWTDRVSIGIAGGPSPANFVFCGFTNAGVGRTDPSPGKSQLVSSDASGGTTNSNYWRVDNSRNARYASQIIQNNVTRAAGGNGERLHFAQANIGTGGPAGYAGLFALRFTRSDARGRARIITMQVKHDPGCLIYSDTPTNDILEAQLESFPTSSINTLGPVEVSHVPDTFSLFWPFHNSRLRIHSMGLLKVL